MFEVNLATLQRLSASDTSPAIEPSQSRGAPDVPEPVTLGAQYLTR